MQRDVVRGDVQFNGANLDAVLALMTPSPVITGAPKTREARALTY